MPIHQRNPGDLAERLSSGNNSIQQHNDSFKDYLGSGTNIATKMSLPKGPVGVPVFPSIRQHVEGNQEDLPERRSVKSQERRDEFLSNTSALGRDKENVTLRGNLEIFEKVLVDIVSELKYHRQQLSIISAEKDTSGAVIQMGIAQAKNSVLSDELKNQHEMKRQERTQNREFERVRRQIEVLNGDTNTADTRLLQMQRRILQLEG